MGMGNGKMPKVLAKTSHTKSEMSDDDCEKISNPSLKANLFPSLMRQVEDSKEMPLVKVENPEDTIYATDSDDNEAILVEDSVSPVYSTAFSRGEWTPPEWTSADLPGQDKCGQESLIQRQALSSPINLSQAPKASSSSVMKSPAAKFQLGHGKNPGFTTATGKPMVVSKSSKAKVLNLFMDEMIECSDVPNEDFPDDFPEILEEHQNPDKKRPLSPVSESPLKYDRKKIKTILKREDVLDVFLEVYDLFYVHKTGKQTIKAQIENLTKENEALKIRVSNLQKEMSDRQEEAKQLKDDLEKYTTLLLLGCNNSPDQGKKSGFFVGAAPTI